VPETNFTLITNVVDLQNAVTELATQQAIGLDTETTGFDPYYSRIRLLQMASPQRSYVVDLFKIDAFEHEGLRLLLESSRPVKVLHNAKFDYKMLKHLGRIEMGQMFDSMLADILALSGKSGSHSLAACCERYLDETIDKSLQSSDWSGALSQSQLEYAAMDAVLVLQLREKLIPRLRELQLIETAKLEFDSIAPIATMELNGVYLDADSWRVVVRNSQAAHDKLAEELKQELAAGIVQLNLFGEPDINLDSPSQVLDAVKRITGLDIEGTRATGLHPLAAQYPVIQK